MVESKLPSFAHKESGVISERTIFMTTTSFGSRNGITRGVRPHTGYRFRLLCTASAHTLHPPLLRTENPVAAYVAIPLGFVLGWVKLPTTYFWQNKRRRLLTWFKDTITYIRAKKQNLEKYTRPKRIHQLRATMMPYKIPTSTRRVKRKEEIPSHQYPRISSRVSKSPW
ncbi:hypothetical protein ACJJTC_010975 [Scirpophaga incertulas]